MRTANFKSAAIAALLSMGLLTGCTNGITNQKTSNHMDTLNLTQEWDKKFPQSNKVNHRKVTFKNRYGITPLRSTPLIRARAVANPVMWHRPTSTPKILARQWIS